ncbi:hypothetical protein GCM10010270_69670 [Streptomyces violaceus]|nr:hypothetical protein GCM10010270_69670 [Streptomyces janthinus]
MTGGMVIFVVSPGGPGFGQGGLDEPNAARNSQDASSQGSVSEAWIDDEEGSINVR